MEITLPSFSIAALFGSFSYIILSLQVEGGFPPILAQAKTHEAKEARENNSIMLFAPKGFLLFPCLGAIVGAAALGSEVLYFIAITGTIAVCIYLGLTVRTFARENYIWPDKIRFRWPFFISPFSRWPMLGFDLWTVGWALAMSLIALLSFSSEDTDPQSSNATEAQTMCLAGCAERHISQDEGLWLAPTRFTA